MKCLALIISIIKNQITRLLLLKTLIIQIIQNKLTLGIMMRLEIDIILIRMENYIEMELKK